MGQKSASHIHKQYELQHTLANSFKIKMKENPILFTGMQTKIGYSIFVA